MIRKKRKKAKIVKIGTMDIHGIPVTVGRYRSREYFCLTDILSDIDGQRHHLETWVRNKRTLAYLAAWERANNPDFDDNDYKDYLLFLKTGNQVSTVNRWITRTKAIGLKTELGRYNGGTYAQEDIALAFVMYIKPGAEIELASQYRKLKKEIVDHHMKVWDIRRELSRAHYRVMTNEVKLKIPLILPLYRHYLIYAAEADMLNIVVFGMTHQRWKTLNPDLKGNQRDNGTLLDNQVMSDLEFQNALMIKEKLDYSTRLAKLREIEPWLRKSLESSPAMRRLCMKYGD